MIAIQLDTAHQKRLEELAAAKGQDGTELARRIIIDFLDFGELPRTSDEQWAEASVALTPEIVDQENWDTRHHGS